MSSGELARDAQGETGEEQPRPTPWLSATAHSISGTIASDAGL